MRHYDTLWDTMNFQVRRQAQHWYFTKMDIETMRFVVYTYTLNIDVQWQIVGYNLFLDISLHSIHVYCA